MKKLESGLMSGLIGIRIGTVWYIIASLIIYQGKNIDSVKLSLNNMIFGVISAFLIGLAFYLASYIFQIDKWSFRKQVGINFFVLLLAWILFSEAINGFGLTITEIGENSLIFILMYAIGYGSYFADLHRQIKEINQKLQKN